MISPIPIYDLVNTGIRFHQYRYTILPIPVYNFGYTVEATFSKIWEGLRSKSKILRNMSTHRIKNKKKSILLHKCPFKECSKKGVFSYILRIQPSLLYFASTLLPLFFPNCHSMATLMLLTSKSSKSIEINLTRNEKVQGVH